MLVDRGSVLSVFSCAHADSVSSTRRVHGTPEHWIFCAASCGVFVFVVSSSKGHILWHIQRNDPAATLHLSFNYLFEDSMGFP